MKKIILAVLLTAVTATGLFAQNYIPKTEEYTKDSYGNEYKLNYLCDFYFTIDEYENWFVKDAPIIYSGTGDDFYGPKRICPKASKVYWKENTLKTTTIEDGVYSSYTQLKWSPLNEQNDDGKRILTLLSEQYLNTWCNYFGKRIPENGYKFSKGTVIETKVKFPKSTFLSSAIWVGTAIPYETEKSFVNGMGATLNDKGYYLNEIDFMELSWDGKNKVTPRGGVFILNEKGETIRHGTGWGPVKNWQSVDTVISTIKIDPKTWFDEWHIVRAEWTDKDIRCYLDGTLYETISWDKKKYGDIMDDFQIKMGIEPEVTAFNLPAPAIPEEKYSESEKYTFQVDYIKVYCEPGKEPVIPPHSKELNWTNKQNSKGEYILFENKAADDAEIGSWNLKIDQNKQLDKNTTVIELSEINPQGSVRWDFSEPMSLEKLKHEGYKLQLEMKAKAENNVAISAYFMDSKAVCDLEWNMTIWINADTLPSDDKWHTITVPLAEMYDAGAWDNDTSKWYDPENKFDWNNIQHFFITNGDKALNGTLTIKSIKLVK